MTTVGHMHSSKRRGVYIGRPSKWGNPFRIGRDGSRQEVLDKYRAWLRSQPALIQAARAELKGRHLLCWCHPLPCHGHILARVAEGGQP